METALPIVFNVQYFLINANLTACIFFKNPTSSPRPENPTEHRYRMSLVTKCDSDPYLIQNAAVWRTPCPKLQNNSPSGSTCADSSRVSRVDMGMQPWVLRLSIQMLKRASWRTWNSKKLVCSDMPPPFAPPCLAIGTTWWSGPRVCAE